MVESKLTNIDQGWMIKVGCSKDIQFIPTLLKCNNFVFNKLTDAVVDGEWIALR